MLAISGTALPGRAADACGTRCRRRSSVTVRRIAMADTQLTFEPQQVADWFAEIMKLPHGSGEEDPLRAAVYTWLTDPSYGIGLPADKVYYQATATAPGERVIHAIRPGTRGKEPIVLQAHMDMVVVTDPKGVNPFPLQPYYDEDGWLKAKGSGGADILSTLGADDGLGIATALALLQDNDLKDYPIECLFTVQEETDMGGAEFFDTGLLEGRTYINLDDEQAGTITYGSAGGFATTYTGPIQREMTTPNPSCVQIVLTGLRGGHSGVDIAKGRPSALKLLVEGLCRMNKRLNDFSLPAGAPPESYDYRLVSLARTDVVKSNAIPTEATAVVALDRADAGPLMDSFEQWFAALQIVYGASEPNMKLELTLLEKPPAEAQLTADATDNLLCFLRLVPQGVIAMIPGYSPAVVETSSNVYDLTLDGTTMTVHTSTRTSNPVLLGSVEDHGHTPLNEMFRNLGKIYGLTVETGTGWYPAWPPNQDSHLLAVAKQVYATVYPAPQTSVIHAGLECGWIVSRYDNMDCIAVGPTIENPHTVDERLDTSSVKDFYSAVKAVMLEVYQEQITGTSLEKKEQEALAETGVLVG
jgi:dipeptidase D